MATYMQDKKWEYNHEWSWTANRDNWVFAVNDERQKYGEDKLSLDLAYVKFEEQYPRNEYDVE